MDVTPDHTAPWWTRSADQRRARHAALRQRDALRAEITARRFELVR